MQEVGPAPGLSAPQRQYLLVAQGVIPFAINFVLNGAIGLLVFAGVNPVPTWGVQSSAAPDLIGTCFFLPAITCLIVTPLVRRHVRSGMVERVPPASFPGWLPLARRSTLARAALFGALGLVLVGGPLAAYFLSIGPDHLALTPFLWLKASFSGVLGALVTPVIGLAALMEA